LRTDRTLRPLRTNRRPRGAIPELHGVQALDERDHALSNGERSSGTEVHLAVILGIENTDDLGSDEVVEFCGLDGLASELFESSHT
jgi:hypothetical protein